MIKNIPANRTWVEIDTEALKHNFQSLASNLNNKETRTMAVVKSNAYGHGIIECAKIFDSAGADFLGVDCLKEAIMLRKAKIKKPILILGWVPNNKFEIAFKYKSSVTISSLDSLKGAVKSNLPLKIHLKIDTGLHRQGIQPQEIQQAIKILRKSKLKLEGLYSHFASAENNSDLPYTKKQFKTFFECAKIFEQNKFKPIKHISASAATILYPEMNLDMARFGVALYGLWPSDEVRKTAQKKKRKVTLKPALAWQVKISEIKKVKKGEPIGYDCSEKVKRDSTIGVVPIGYWHGFPRHASSRAIVLVKDKTAKILGKVSMDMSVIDLTNIGKVKQGDVATIIGLNQKKTLPCEDLASKCETINYEIVTRINPEITRIYF